MVEKLIFKLLSEHAQLAPLIGAGTDCRVYPNEAPEKVIYPYVVFSQAGYKEDDTFDGSLAENLFAFFIFPPRDLTSSNYISGKEIAREIRAAFRGQNWTEFGVCVSRIRPANQRDEYFPEYKHHGVVSTYYFDETI